MKKTEELRKLDANKLEEELKAAEEQLFKTSFDVTNGQSKNAHLIKRERRYVARIKTIQKELASVNKNN